MASQVLVKTRTVHEVPVCVSVSKFTVAPLQASDAVGAVKFGVAVQSIVALPPGWPIVGACVSLIVMTCVLVAEWFPHASVASHILVIMLEQPLPVVVDDTRFTVAPLQASLAVGAVKFGMVVHSIVALPPAWPMDGACESTTVIDWLTVAL